MAFLAPKSCLDLLVSLSKVMNPQLTLINVAEADLLYTVALAAMKQWKGSTAILESWSAEQLSKMKPRVVYSRHKTCLAKFLMFSLGIFALWTYSLSVSRKGFTQDTQCNKCRNKRATHELGIKGCVCGESCLPTFLFLWLEMAVIKRSPSFGEYLVFPCRLFGLERGTFLEI